MSPMAKLSFCPLCAVKSVSRGKCYKCKTEFTHNFIQKPRRKNSSFELPKYKDILSPDKRDWQRKNIFK